MTPAVLVLAAAVALAVAGTLHRLDGRGAVRRLVPPSGTDAGAERAGPAERFGGWLLRLVPGAPSPSPAFARRVGASVPAAGAVAALGGAVPAAALLVVALGPVVIRERRRPAAASAAAVARLPDVVELLGVAARAGLPAAAAVAHVAERAPPPWGGALAAVVGRTVRGDRFGDALDELRGVVADGGGDSLGVVLRSAADDGADLVAGLDRLAGDARDLRRRRAEEAARRVPVRLLLPLVACSLPAFALLTIVPILAGAVRDLDL